MRKLLMGAALVAVPVGAFAQFSISVNIAPPELPVYAQPICPGDGFLWTPGYWAYGPEGYFWVPGVWVEPPTVGYLWTPAYWGYNDGGYRFFPGYWGPHIGFYGGVNYGFGYFGHGYEGGYWDRDRFFYNQSVNNINERYERNVYVRNVTVVNNYNRVSYNGGEGIHDRPGREELQAQRERHFEPTSVQQEHQQLASHDRGQFASVNGGRPEVQAARTPQEFQQRAQRGGFGGNVPSNNAPTSVLHSAQAQQGPQMQARHQGQQTQVTSQQPLNQQQPGPQRVPPEGRPNPSQGQVQPAQQRGDWQARQRQDDQQRAQYQQQARQQQVQQQQSRQQQAQQQQAQQQQAQQQQQVRQQQYQQRAQYPPQAQQQQARPQPQQQSRPQEGGRPGLGDRQRR